MASGGPVGPSGKPPAFDPFGWAERYVATPFSAMYGFYVPQLTLVKVLLAGAAQQRFVDQDQQLAG